MSKYKIAGLTRVRNESLIIQETLDHMAEFCTAGIYVYDDASTDNTRKLCEKHPAVVRVIGNKTWDAHRHHNAVEGDQRYRLVQEARKDNPDWFLYLDADERLFWNFEGFSNEYDIVVSRLFDFYITPEDKDREYTGNLPQLRRLCGPEYRRITALYKNLPHLAPKGTHHRNPVTNGYENVLYAGYIRHYGKAISVKHWEDTCDFYIKHYPEYPHWQKRKGKAVHTLSDFGRDLYSWKDVHKHNLVLTQDMYK